MIASDKNPWREKLPNSLRPLISCVVCAFGEGDALRASLESLWAQSFKNFEVIVVDDGCNTDTRTVLEDFLVAKRDERFRWLRQSNDGLSSARNRGIRHAAGKYVCFLDGDDTRPPWAFEMIAEAIEDSEPDVIYTRGALSELRGELLDFYDTLTIGEILNTSHGVSKLDQSNSLFKDVIPHVALMEPQAANKIVKKSIFDRYVLAFPNNLFFEDILFHVALLSVVNSIAVINCPCFTYYRRYGHAQITSGSGDSRMDAVAVASMTLEAFEQSPRFQNSALRAAVLLGITRLLKWCGESISHSYREQYNLMIKSMMKNISPYYLDAISHNRDKFRHLDTEIQFISSIN